MDGWYTHTHIIVLKEGSYCWALKTLLRARHSPEPKMSRTAFHHSNLKHYSSAKCGFYTQPENSVTREVGESIPREVKLPYITVL